MKPENLDRAQVLNDRLKAVDKEIANLERWQARRADDPKDDKRLIQVLFYPGDDPKASADYGSSIAASGSWPDEGIAFDAVFDTIYHRLGRRRDELIKEIEAL